MDTTVRPTKMQKQLLDFVETFIAEHGYGPSYREIMRGCNYNSVATVALHVNNLILRGHLRKSGRSARSLEVVSKSSEPASIATNVISPKEEKWLVEKVDYKFREVEEAKAPLPGQVDGLYVLIGALKVLGLDGAAQSFMSRLSVIKKNTKP
jgi:SOS-response transcriptional repressor LexA